MKSNYSRLGDYINEVDERNADLSITNLLGVSMEKTFIPSVANITGVDLSIYKVLRKNQLACKLMSVGRDEKLPVDIYKDDSPAIVSSAYYVFEPKDEAELLPDYLYMWLCRPENDRYIGFISGGDVRGGISWETFCNIPIKVPNIIIQRELVKEYNAILNNIKLNEKICKNIEETGIAIYKEWFEKFDFPDVNEQPYKSSGGQMVFNSELEQELPKDWKYCNLDDVSTIKAGGDKPSVFSFYITSKLNVPIYSNSSLNEGLYGFTDQATIKNKCITVSARGAIIGYTVLRTKPFVPIIRLIVVIPKSEILLNYLYDTIKNFKYNDSGSAQGQLTVPDISSQKIILPSDNILKKYQQKISVLSNYVNLKRQENKKLTELINVLFSKLATIEN